jgi:hypothetical protein
MEISVRSYLTAGTAAVVGAAAIGLSPAMPAPDLRAAAVVAEIALTGTSVPWESVIAVVKALSTGGSLQGGITSLISSIGTEVAKEALPIVTAAAGDVVKYIGTALGGLISGGGVQIDIQKVIEAATAAITAGNIGDAVKALTSGLSASVGQISKVLFTPEFQSFVIGKAGTVLGALPEILRSAVQKIVGLDIKPLIDMLSGLLSKIIPGVTLPAAVVAAPRALAAAAAPAAVASTLAVPAAAAAETAPAAAPEAVAAPAAPAQDSSAKAPVGESTPAAKSAPESAPPAEVSVPAVEAAPEATAVADVPAVEVPEAVAPTSPRSAPVQATAPAENAAAPAPTRLAKPASRGHDAAKSAASSASSSRG